MSSFPSNPSSLMDELKLLGVDLWREGERLRYRGPEKALTQPLVQALKEHKEELLALVDRRAAGAQLSRRQQALWFLDRVRPSAAYHLLYAVRLKRGVDAAALARAFASLVERYPILRTV